MILFILIFPFPVFAQNYAYELNETHSFSCMDSEGTPVEIIEDSGLEELGHASFRMDENYYPNIVFNPEAFSQMDIRIRMFWFAHECGHHSLGHVRQLAFNNITVSNLESDTDCKAVHILIEDYNFSIQDILHISSTLIYSSGLVRGHLPGPTRASLLLSCLF
jgi:hypothetical protein